IKKGAYGMKNLTRKAAVLCIAGIVGIQVPAAAFAASPEFARSEQEWEKLRDQVLEYEEIPDLIHEYNATVQNNRYEYHKFIQDYGTTREDVSDAYRDLADDLEADKSGEDGMGMVSDFQLEQQAKRLREQADDNLEDSQIYYWTYCQAEDNLALSAQSKFLSYYKKQLELEQAKDTKQSLESTYEQTVMRRQTGMATDMEVLDAQEAVQEQEKTIAELEQQIENTRQNLIIMCGWKGSDQPEIREIPQLDFEELDAIDLEADIQTALETNYTLLINKKKLENALDSDNKENIRKQIAANERQIGVSVTNAWQNLLTARRSYEQAVSDMSAKERDMALTEQKWAAGMITKYDYESSQIALNASKASVETSYMELIEALETYRWNVGGLAIAE
ncbi:MAG: TolC family protein, partial [Brotaphodocola sp.]